MIQKIIRAIFIMAGLAVFDPEMNDPVILTGPER